MTKAIATLIVILSMVHDNAIPPQRLSPSFNTTTIELVTE